jgi:hypothetical protein
LQPCQRKWRIVIPDEYIETGRTPMKTFFVGIMNLEVELDGEETKCLPD